MCRDGWAKAWPTSCLWSPQGWGVRWLTDPSSQPSSTAEEQGQQLCNQGKGSSIFSSPLRVLSSSQVTKLCRQECSVKERTPSCPKRTQARCLTLFLRAQYPPPNCDMLTVALWIATFPYGCSCNKHKFTELGALLTNLIN